MVVEELACLDPFTTDMSQPRHQCTPQMLITFEDEDDLNHKIDTMYHKLDEDASGGLDFEVCLSVCGMCINRGCA